MKKLFPFSIFVLFVVVFFSPTIFQGRLPVPTDTLVGLYHPWRDLYKDEYPRGIPFKNFLITDPIRQQIPWRKIGIEDFKKGNLPLWNPYSFSGTPLLGNIQTGLFYPLNMLFFVTSFQSAWSILILLQPLLAGVFLYFFLSSKKLNSWACLISSISWSFSGFSIAWLTWGTIVHTVLWLPLFLFSIDKLLSLSEKKQKVTWSLVLALSLSFSFFAGHVQIFFYSILCSVGYLVFALIVKKISWREKLPSFILSTGIFGVVTLFQWKQLYSMVAMSSRVAQENQMNKEGWFLPWQHLVQFFIPDFFGNPATLNYWGTWNYGEMVGYIGIVPLLLAFIGMYASRYKERIYWIGVLIVTFVFLLPTPFAKIPYLLHIPILSALQPTRLIVLIVFSLIMLCGYGAHALIENIQEKKLSIRIPVGIFSSIFAIVFMILFVISRFFASDEMKLSLNVSIRNSIFPLAIFIVGCIQLFFLKMKKFQTIVLGTIILFVCLDLFRFGKKFTPFTDPQYFFPSTKIISYLQAQPKPFRVLAADDRILPSNVGGFYDIEMVSGYDPLYSHFYEDFIAVHNRGNPNTEKPYGFNRIITPSLSKTPVFDLLGITYVLTYGPINNPEFSFVLNEGETYLYKIDNSLPRFFFVNEIISLPSYEKEIISLFTDLNVRHQAIIQERVNIPIYPVQEHESLNIIAYENSSVTLQSITDTDRYMVILNSYYPGWKAYVDGKLTPIFRTNAAFMGMVVPSGQHTIQLSYEG